MVSWENSPARPLWGLFTTATITEQTTTAWLSSEVGRTKTVGNIAQALADLPPAARAVLAGTPRNPTTRSNPFLDRNAGSGGHTSRIAGADTQTAPYQIAPNSSMMGLTRKKIFPL